MITAKNGHGFSNTKKIIKILNSHEITIKKIEKNCILIIL